MCVCVCACVVSRLMSENERLFQDATRCQPNNIWILLWGPSFVVAVNIACVPVKGMEKQLMHQSGTRGDTSLALANPE